jgi:hypothetical protein
MPSSASPTKPTASAFGPQEGDGYILNIPKGGYPYEAFRAPAEHQPHFLVILRRKDGHICPGYHRLDDIDFDPGGTWILLDFGSEVINLKGRNLHPVVEKLLDKRVEMIVEFDSATYGMLQEDKPIITEIETHDTRPASRNEVKALFDRIARLERLLEKAGE